MNKEIFKNNININDLKTYKNSSGMYKKYSSFKRKFKYVFK